MTAMTTSNSIKVNASPGRGARAAPTPSGAPRCPLILLSSHKPSRLPHQWNQSPQPLSSGFCISGGAAPNGAGPAASQSIQRSANRQGDQKARPLRHSFCWPRQARARPWQNLMPEGQGSGNGR